MSSVEDIASWGSEIAVNLVKIAETVEQNRFMAQKEHARWRQGMYEIAHMIGMEGVPDNLWTPESIVARLRVVIAISGIKSPKE